uniref:Uncharacterized protein n=1 Tax=Dicentrarchus labrax TaxID=13489 RepID=A0A8C4GWG2_DICLA
AVLSFSCLESVCGANLHDDCIQETTQGGGSSVMVWAGIHYGGKTPLVVLDGNVNAVVNRDILENHCLPHRDNIPQSLQELALDLSELWDALPSDGIN